MYITQNDILNMRIRAGRPMSDGEILFDLLRDHKQSPEYQHAVDGQRYYLALHDVLEHDFRQEHLTEDVEDPETGARAPQNTVFTNPNRSNHHASNPFFREQVIQKAAYLLGKEPSVSVEGAEASKELAQYADALSDTTDAAFNRAVKRWCTQASIGGRAFLHEYKDADGALKQAVVTYTNALPVYDQEYEETLQELIYFYETRVRLGADRWQTITHAEWWTKGGVTYWIHETGDSFRPDPEKPGVQPHYWEVTLANAGPDGVTMVEVSREGKVFERFPWIELKNNEDGTGDLLGVKDLIDAYDLVQNTGTNNILDFNEFFAIIQGFGGEQASTVVRKLRVNRAVNVGSAAQSGNIELKQLDLGMQGRIDWLKALRDAIYEFGMAVDVKSVENLGSAPSGTSLKFQYTLLDLKAENMISEMRPALSEHFWFVTQEINRAQGTEYDASLVDVSFNKSLIVNDTDTVAIITQSADIVPERILLAHHPFVTDPDAAMKEMKEQRKQKAREQQKLMGAYGIGPEKDEDGEKDEDQA